ncbi:MAG: Hsp33 family molecular chaperone HslO [Desulfobacterales bacterium]
MRKKKRYGNTPKEQYEASARDRVHRFMMADESVRGAILHGTRMINEMRANHELGILETLVLGRAYLGAALMAAGLKGDERIVLKIDCSGPVKGLVVEANAFGEVRGYLKRVPIPIDRPLEDTDLAPFFGAGLLSVTRYQRDAKAPFTSQVILRHGNLAQDLACYHLESEQIPTAFRLGIDFDKEGNVAGAGGLFLQAMPGADEETAGRLEGTVTALPQIGLSFTRNGDPRKLVKSWFAAFHPRFTDDKRVEFMCHCSRTRIRGLLMMLPIDELKDIRENGPFPLELRCHNCNTKYQFSRESIAKIYGRRFPDN